MGLVKPVRVAVVEDSEAERARLGEVIRGEPRYELVGSYATRSQVEASLPKTAPELILLDLMIPGVPSENEMELLSHLRSRVPAARIIIITINDDPALLWRALQFGSSGYLVKPVTAANLLRALEDVANGGAVFAPFIAARLVRHFEAQERARQGWNLTNKERETLEHLCAGLDREEVCAKMNIKTAGLRAHMQNIYQKLHVSNESGAVAKFLGSPPKKSKPTQR